MSLETICKAYANPGRIRLIICLSKEGTVSELLTKCHLSQSALSQHLAVLRKAGVVVAQRRGTHMYYKTVSVAHVQLAKMITKLANID